MSVSLIQYLFPLIDSMQDHPPIQILHIYIPMHFSLDDVPMASTSLSLLFFLQGGVIEESFLETPTSILAVVFLCLQAMSIIFQFIVNSLKRLLRSRNRLGMITALDHSVWELTLVGFISLCLIALQSQITSICGTYTV